MAQVQIRTTGGHPIVAASVRLATEDQDSAHAYDERFTDAGGNTAFPAPVPASRYMIHVNYTDDGCGRRLRSRYEPISVAVRSLDADVVIHLDAKKPLPLHYEG